MYCLVCTCLQLIPCLSFHLNPLPHTLLTCSPFPSSSIHVICADKPTVLSVWPPYLLYICRLTIDHYTLEHVLYLVQIFFFLLICHPSVWKNTGRKWILLTIIHYLGDMCGIYWKTVLYCTNLQACFFVLVLRTFRQLF